VGLWARVAGRAAILLSWHRKPLSHRTVLKSLVDETKG
jgi:hypothetical protein